MEPISDELLDSIVKKVVEQELLQRSSSAAPQTKQPPASNPASAGSTKVISLGTDHGGVDLKEILKKDLVEQGFEVIDCGTNTKDAVDYPDIALAVAQLVASGKAWRGIVIDGAGIGSCMTANKVPGIRAALCYDYATAVNSREHNDANVLTLGAGLIGVNLAKQIVKTWLNTEFGGGRHANRVNKIIAVEQSYLKEGTAK
jgi:ribose 5-phosphate isomerase B